MLSFTRCKFSHDPAVERKAVKRNVYEQEEENMDEWTDEKLAEVVSKKHAGNTDTDIICKNFLDALENNKYGRDHICMRTVKGLIVTDDEWEKEIKRHQKREKERMRFRGEKIIKYVQDGFGNARMGVKTASIDTLYPKTMC